MKVEKLPSPDRIDSIISDFKVTGLAKSSLITLKEHLLEHIGEKNGYIVEVDKEAFVQIINNFSENKKLKEELLFYKNMTVYKYIIYKIKNNIKILFLSKL